ncbi:CaiB/BaiF CoA transferase family protein [Sneathiella chinensis]|uniref:CoA transferase n=1 Tax=Sneathiella chinensis TaxID=349750 RepID=A0ABQ5U3R0_9PROT|nr:CoA transferase [Sneathiella chinensis]GLQ05126.1 CoA transferase [Sneathiella chinensis]
MMLSDIRVLEIGQNLSGPFAGAILADLGATVEKIEKQDGDDARKWGPPISPDSSAIFHLMNRGKSSVVLNLKEEQGKAQLRSLIAESDILIHNMRPGTMAALGLDGQTLTAQFPHLIYCDMGAFGHKGPLRNRPGYEPLMQAFAGLVSVNGHPDGPEARIGASVVDLGTGMWTAIGALAALWNRARTGKGCIVNTSLLETALMWGASHLATYVTSGFIPARHGTGHPLLVPYQAFETQDGPLVIAPGNDRLFKALVGALGHPEWAEDPRFLNNELRRKHKEEIIGLIAGVIRPMPMAELEEKLNSAGVPNAPIRTMPQVLEDSQVQALDILQPLPGLKDVAMMALPVSFNGERPKIRSAAPAIGEVAVPRS